VGGALPLHVLRPQRRHHDVSGHAVGSGAGAVPGAVREVWRPVHEHFLGGQHHATAVHQGGVRAPRAAGGDQHLLRGQGGLEGVGDGDPEPCGRDRDSARDRGPGHLHAEADGKGDYVVPERRFSQGLLALRHPSRLEPAHRFSARGRDGLRRVSARPAFADAPAAAGRRVPDPLRPVQPVLHPRRGIRP
jgi:hypothetical protein